MSKVTKLYQAKVSVPKECQIAIRDDGVIFARVWVSNCYKGRPGWDRWEEVDSLPEGLSDDLLIHDRVRLPLSRKEQEARDKEWAEERAKREVEEEASREVAKQRFAAEYPDIIVWIKNTKPLNRIKSENFRRDVLDFFLRNGEMLSDHMIPQIRQHMLKTA